MEVSKAQAVRSDSGFITRLFPLGVYSPVLVDSPYMNNQSLDGGAGEAAGTAGLAFNSTHGPGLCRVVPKTYVGTVNRC